MFINNFDPVAFQIFSIEIRWYSLAYIIGILLGWLYCKKKLIKDNNVSNLFDDYITFLIIGMIIGGRLGYVLFYNFNYYLKNSFEIFAIWNGGMSFHGAVIGIIIASLFFSNKKKINNFTYLDLVSLSAPIGIFFGRIANFINSELYGRPTEVAWSVKFKLVDGINRHPSQLFKSFIHLIFLSFIFFFCIFFRKLLLSKILTLQAFLKLGKLLKVLINIFIISPLPAPNSIKLNFLGHLRFSQNEMTHMAIISENKIEIFGAVIKSPFFPKGSLFI